MEAKGGKDFLWTINHVVFLWFVRVAFMYDPV